MPRPGRIASRRVAFLVAVVVAGLVSAFGTSSASPTTGSRAATSPSGTGQLPPDDSAALVGADALASTSYSAKAKIAIRVPPSYAIVYFIPTYRGSDADTVTPAPKYYLPQHPSNCDYQFVSLPADAYVADVKQTSQSKPAIVRSVGKFPDTTVSMLAFGSIPVTATLHVSQVVRHGKIVPLKLDGVTSATALFPDGSFGCDPDWEASVPQPTTSEGQLDATVSDVRVDERRVDVGTNCRTTAPLDLHLIGQPPLYASNFEGGTLIQRVDHSTVTKDDGTYPLYPNSRNLTIPSFVGCRNRATGEDISRLITAMVSGPDNSLTVQQGKPILNGTTREHPSLCYAPGQSTDPDQCAKLPDNPPALAPGH